ncbi:hypothetical protein GF402_06020 [Candidatus Fermentibacteria bacterium]|nr:hypothetical protein [Candidatus Fermentibacteria bacterium]
MLHNKPVSFWVLLTLSGMMTGTVFGEAMAGILPETSTTLRSFFGGSLDVSIGPLKFDLIVIRFWLQEVGVKLNLMSFVGLLVVGYLYRWF